MGGVRIRDRFAGVGRKLNDAGKAAVEAMHARYPKVALRQKPGQVAAEPAFSLAVELRWVRILHQLMHLQIDIAAAKKRTPSGVIEETSCGS